MLASRRQSSYSCPTFEFATKKGRVAMKVLLITNFFAPEKTGIGVTATDCAKFISDLEHEVVVVTGMPYYPEWKVHRQYRGKLFYNETIEGIPVKRSWLYVPRQPSTLKRIIHEISLSGMAFFRALCIPGDLILCISPALSLAFVSAILSKIKRKKFWCSIKDIQPDAAIDLGMLKNKWIIKFSKFMESFVYNTAEKIIVLSDGMKQNIANKGIAEEKIAVVPDSIDISELSVEPNSGSRFRKANSLEDKFLVLYSGNLGIKHNVELIVECAKELQKETEIYFAVVGRGAAQESLERKIEDYQLENIKLYPLVEREDLGDMLCSADLLLAPQKREVVDIVVPSKLLAYLTSKRPIIASVNSSSEAARLLTKYNAGVVTEPENSKDLAQAILSCRENPQWAAKLGEAGFNLVASSFDHSVILKRYYQPLFGEVLTV